MQNYKIILSDISFFSILFIVAWLLSNVFPGRVRPSASQKGEVASFEVKHLFRHLMLTIYILVLSFVIDGFLDLSVFKIPLPQTVHTFLQSQDAHFDAWIMFWCAAAALYFVDFRFRASYLKRNQTVSVSSLLSSILRMVALFLIALWIAKYVLGWHSTHVLVSATVMAAVMGYTLKNTLGDLLSGISLHLSRSVLPSEWIHLPTLNLSGEVISTNWRETRLRTSNGHVYIIPNSIISTTHFHNMSWPDSLRRHNLDFILGFSTSPETVERALVEATSGIPLVLQSPKPPQVIIKAFMEFGVHYQLRFWSNSFYERGSLESKIYKAAWSQLNQQKVEYLSLKSNLVLKRRAEENAPK